MTSEKSSFEPELLDTVKVIDTFTLMSDTSLRLLVDLRKIYGESNASDNNIAMAVFGSPSRYEMLPNSDVDVLLFHNKNSHESCSAVSDLRNKIKTLPYDKIDTPQAVVCSTDLLSIANSNSPDGHMADCFLVASPLKNKLADDIQRANKVLLKPELQLQNMIFGYHFLSHRAKLKRSEDGANLKYSEGGSRDLLYLDWAGNQLTHQKITQNARKLGRPVIEASLPIIIDRITPDIPLQLSLQAVDIINSVKHHALTLAKEGVYFDGLMSDKTAHLLVKNFDYGNAIDAALLKRAHLNARNLISEVKKEVYVYFKNELMQRTISDNTYEQLVLIDKVWNNKVPKEQTHDIYNTLIEEGSWVSITTVVAQKDISGTMINRITEIATTRPGYDFTLRLVAQHPNTPTKTLLRLLESHRIASDDDIDARYRSIIKKRLDLL